MTQRAEATTDEVKIKAAVATQLQMRVEKAKAIIGPMVAPAVMPRAVAIATSDIPYLVSGFWNQRR